MGVAVEEGISGVCRVIMIVAVIPCGESHVAGGHFIIETHLRAHHFVAFHPAAEVIAHMARSGDMDTLSEITHGRPGGADPSQAGGGGSDGQSVSGIGIGRIGRVVALSASSAQGPCTRDRHDGQQY